MRPRLREMDEFKISPDPQLVGLSTNPAAGAAMVAVDEKPQVRARSRNGTNRNGNVDPFAALDIATGQVITDLHRTTKKVDRESPTTSNRRSCSTTPGHAGPPQCRCQTARR